MINFKHMRISLQTKILGLLLFLMLFIILSLTGIFIYMQFRDTGDQIGQLALQTAKTASFMSSVKSAFNLEEPSSDLPTVLERLKEDVGADTIDISDRKGNFFQPEIAGTKIPGVQNALYYGNYYITRVEGRMGPSLRGVAPIYNDEGQIIGAVSVTFLIKKMHAEMLSKMANIALWSFIILAFGVIGGIMLARNIRKDTLGLEPHEIAALYRERSAILQSIKEGVIAVDQRGCITLMNASAMEMFGLQENCLHMPIEQVYPYTKMYQVLRSGKKQINREMQINERTFLVSRIPIIDNGQVIGAVASFRDKTEIKEMVDTISEVRQYSEDLRAQTHEFSNRLYVLSGLLQLGKVDEAVKMIQSESATQNQQNKILFEHIGDSNVQAILLGKLGKASEKKISFMVDENSSIGILPEHFCVSQMITIIGNLIDNAFDAVFGQKKKQVAFFAVDLGEEVIFEVADNGSGIGKSEMAFLFEKGFSTKDGDHRGYGLYNVRETVGQLGGTIECSNQPDGGAVFTVFLPKSDAQYNEAEGLS